MAGTRRAAASSSRSAKLSISRKGGGPATGRPFSLTSPGFTRERLRMALNDPVTTQILAFLDRIGIPVVMEAIEEDTLLPAMTVRGGRLIVDPARLTLVGDLLHEAGHVAVTDPAVRATLSEFPSDPAEEMA